MFQEEIVFTSENLDAAARARSAFTLVVHATSANTRRTGYVRGRDIYRAGAVAAVETAIRLTGGHDSAKSGVLGAARKRSLPRPSSHICNSATHSRSRCSPTPNRAPRGASRRWITGMEIDGDLVGTRLGGDVEIRVVDQLPRGGKPFGIPGRLVEHCPTEPR
jgi:hypothetical protein